MAKAIEYMQVATVARELGISRWDVLMQCLHKTLKYRPTTTGVEITTESVRAAAKRRPR